MQTWECCDVTLHSQCKYRAGVDSSQKIVGRNTVLMMLGNRAIWYKLTVGYQEPHFRRNLPLTSTANQLFIVLWRLSYILFPGMRACLLALIFARGGEGQHIVLRARCTKLSKFENGMHFTYAYLLIHIYYCLNVYLSVIHSITRKPHLSVVWNWYYLFASLHGPGWYKNGIAAV